MDILKMLEIRVYFDQTWYTCLSNVNINFQHVTLNVAFDLLAHSNSKGALASCYQSLGIVMHTCAMILQTSYRYIHNIS